MPDSKGAVPLHWERVASVAGRVRGDGSYYEPEHSLPARYVLLWHSR